MNTHNIQGATADRAIGVMDSRETNLTDARLFLFNVIRARDSLELFIDSRARIDAALTRNPGDKSAALETIGEIVSAARATVRQAPIFGTGRARTSAGLKSRSAQPRVFRTSPRRVEVRAAAASACALTRSPAGLRSVRPLPLLLF